MTRAEYYELLRTRDDASASYFYQLPTNHPSRLLTITPSGSITMSIDGKGASDYDDYEIDLSFDMSLMEVWAREFGNNFHTVQQPMPDDHFRMMVEPLTPWAITDYQVGTATPQIIGDVVIRSYQETSPGVWTLDETHTVDVEAYFVPTFAASGGDSVSGGQASPSSGFHEITMRLETDTDGTGVPSGMYSAVLRAIAAARDAVDAVIIERAPWSDAWAAESTPISDAFDAMITANDGVDGVAWSGSCSLTYTFGY